MKPILGSSPTAGGRAGPWPPPLAAAAAVVVTTGPAPDQKRTSRPARTMDGRSHHHRWFSGPPQAPDSPGDTALEAGPPSSPGSTPVPATGVAAAAVITGHTASSESRAARAVASRPYRLICIPDHSPGRRPRMFLCPGGSAAVRRMPSGRHHSPHPRKKSRGNARWRARAHLDIPVSIATHDHACHAFSRVSREWGMHEQRHVPRPSSGCRRPRGASSSAPRGRCRRAGCAIDACDDGFAIVDTAATRDSIPGVTKERDTACRDAFRPLRARGGVRPVAGSERVE